MIIQEKINLALQASKLYLFKEGMFYKLYNQNAMWFVQNVKPYKVSAKFVKTVSQDVYSIGFPQHVLKSGVLDFNFKQEQDITAYLCYKTKHSIDEQAYVNWCNTALANQTSKQSETTTQNIVQQLKQFDVANNTPMQALEFVANLKTLL